MKKLPVEYIFKNSFIDLHYVIENKNRCLLENYSIIIHPTLTLM